MNTKETSASRFPTHAAACVAGRVHDKRTLENSRVVYRNGAWEVDRYDGAVLLGPLLSSNPITKE